MSKFFEVEDKGDSVSFIISNPGRAGIACKKQWLKSVQCREVLTEALVRHFQYKIERNLELELKELGIEIDPSLELPDIAPMTYAEDI